MVDEAFVLRVSDRLPLEGVGPLLCAGITTYSPLRHWKVGPGHKVGVVGLGGLGHMAVKFAHAFGARTVLFTTSPGKADDGGEGCGGPAGYVLVDRRDRKPVRPLAFHAHDGRELGPGDMEPVPAGGPGRVPTRGARRNAISPSKPVAAAGSPPR